MSAYTRKELAEMWRRPPEQQYRIAVSKIMEAIKDTKGDICIMFSGGKDSSLLLDMYCDVIRNTEYKDKPIKVGFANTTNETRNMLTFINEFIQYLENKYGVKIDFQETRPDKGVVWAKYVLENGIPLISKSQSKAIRTAKRDIQKFGLTWNDVERLAKRDVKCVSELIDIGFTKTSVLAMTGWVSRRNEFGKMFKIATRWLPMVMCPVDLDDRCCLKIKERPLDKINGDAIMKGEQASESAVRENQYLQTGCNARAPDGKYTSKPFGPMTRDGILYSILKRGTPICADYGKIVYENGHYRCTGAQRTGCALCGFGCQYDTERFVRLQDTEPAKVAFAFKPLAQGGAGYLEAIQYMNEYCGTNIKIPELK